jgi:hypothetical protein
MDNRQTVLGFGKYNTYLVLMNSGCFTLDKPLYRRSTMSSRTLPLAYLETAEELLSLAKSANCDDCKSPSRTAFAFSAASDDAA